MLNGKTIQAEGKTLQGLHYAWIVLAVAFVCLLTSAAFYYLFRGISLLALPYVNTLGGMLPDAEVVRPAGAQYAG